MYDEHGTVLETMTNIRNSGKKSPIILIHSDDQSSNESMADIFNLVSVYKRLPNLANTVEHTSHIPAFSLSRNYSEGVRTLFDEYNLKIDESQPFYVVFITGDTFVYDLTTFDRIAYRLRDENKIAAITQAIGSEFYDEFSVPGERMGGRMQHEKITDIMPQMFVIDGHFLKRTGAMKEIPIVNKFTSEHCLGNALLKHFNNDPDEFHSKVIRLADRAYNFFDGMVYHQK